MITLGNLYENRKIIIERCRRHEACQEEFNKLINAKTKEEFEDVIRDNFNWVNKNQIIDYPRFDDAYNFREGNAMIILNDKYGFINSDGTYLIEPKFSHAYDFYENKAYIQLKHKYGVIDLNGTITWRTKQRGGAAMITLENLYENREEIIKRCKERSACKEEFAKLINTKTKEEFEETIRNNFHWVNRYQIIDYPRFDVAHDFREGNTVVVLNNKCGFINSDGSYLVEPKFDLAYGFSETKAFVQLNNKDGFINLDGSYLVEPKFDWASNFCESKAMIIINKKYGFINLDGSYLVEPKFDWAHRFNESKAMIKSNDKYGFINSDGSYLVKPNFDWADNFREGKARIKLKNKYGSLDLNGVVTWKTNEEGEQL